MNLIYEVRTVRVESQSSHTMDDSIELPALAMSIDDEVKAEAVDQTVVSERFCSSA